MHEHHPRPGRGRARSARRCGRAEDAFQPVAERGAGARRSASVARNGPSRSIGTPHSLRMTRSALRPAAGPSDWTAQFSAARTVLRLHHVHPRPGSDPLLPCRPRSRAGQARSGSPGGPPRPGRRGPRRPGEPRRSSPTSPIATRSGASARSLAAEATARAEPRSAAGSTTRMPPDRRGEDLPLVQAQPGAAL